jgi:hypothetical protein
VPWTEKELYTIDTIWGRGIKASLRLASSTDTAIALLPAEDGGLNLTPAAWHMAKELGTHIAQCTSKNDELHMLLKRRMNTTLHLVGARNMEEAAKLITERGSWKLYVDSPFMKLQRILMGCRKSRSVQVAEAAPAPQQPELAESIRKMKDAADNKKVWDPVTDEEIETNKRAARWTTAETTIRVLHAHNLYSVESMLEQGMPTMKRLAALPQRVQMRWTKQHMQDLREAIKDSESVQSRTKTIDVGRKLASQPVSAKKHEKEIKDSPWGAYKLEMSAFENADAFDLEGGRTGEMALDLFFGEPFLGVVVAVQKNQRGDPSMYRIIYSDGDTKDYDPQEIALLCEQAMDPESVEASKPPSMLFPEQTVEAEWYAEQWRSRHPGIVESICQKRKEELGDTRFLVCWKWGKSKNWRKNIYEVDTEAADRKGTWLWKISIDKGDNLERTGERVLLEHGEKWGVHTIITLEDERVDTIGDDEVARLNNLCKTRGSTQAEGPALKKLKGTMHAHFGARDTRTRQAPSTIPNSEQPKQFSYVPTQGQGQPQRIELDWNTHLPVTYKDDENGLISVTRNELMQLYETREDSECIPDDDRFPQ